MLAQSRHCAIGPGPQQVGSSDGFLRPVGVPCLWLGKSPSTYDKRVAEGTDQTFIVMELVSKWGSQRVSK